MISHHVDQQITNLVASVDSAENYDRVTTRVYTLVGVLASTCAIESAAH